MKRDLKADLELCNQYKRLDKFGTSNFENFKRAGRISSNFMASAKEGWPYAIERAMRAESLVRELVEALGGLSYYVAMGEIHTERFLKDYSNYKNTLYKAKEVLDNEQA